MGDRCGSSLCLSEESVTLYRSGGSFHATFTVTARLGVAAARVGPEPWQDAHTHGCRGSVKHAPSRHISSGHRFLLPCFLF